MREIKFRVWNAKIVSKASSGPPLRHRIMQYIDMFDTDGNYIVGSSTYIDEEAVIMQYTGLKDENGVEIYEGDRVEFWGGNGVVIYSNGAFVISHTPEMDTLSSSEFDFYDGITVHVIGNIYENKV